MSGENIYNLLAADAKKQQANGDGPAAPSAYTGNYPKHFKEPAKPVYSTFYEKGKEYDSSHSRYYKQRDAVIGKSVADTVYPDNYLKKGEGVKSIVPPIHKERMYTKPPVSGLPFAGEGGGGGGNGGNSGGAGDGAGADGGPSGADGARGAGGDGGNGSGANGGGYAGFPGYNDGVMGVPKSRKNFIASNIVEMSNLVPKNRKDQPQFATDRKDFGKTPAYLGRVKQEVEHEENFIRAIDTQKAQHREQVLQRYVYRLPPAEQAHLVATLEKSLKEKSHALASMPLSKDTMTAAKKKSELHKSIDDIEIALAKLAKEAIFIYKDDPVNGQWTKAAALEECKKFVMETA